MSKEEMLEELADALETYNEHSYGEYGFSLDKELGVITIKTYGDYNEETNEVEVESTEKYMLVRYSD